MKKELNVLGFDEMSSSHSESDVGLSENSRRHSCCMHANSRLQKEELQLDCSAVLFPLALYSCTNPLNLTSASNASIRRPLNKAKMMFLDTFCCCLVIVDLGLCFCFQRSYVVSVFLLFPLEIQMCDVSATNVSPKNFVEFHASNVCMWPERLSRKAPVPIFRIIT